jgi:Meckel syndrome type 1 protein
MTAPPAASPAPAQAASAPPPAAQASATTQGARFYSLHRDYGLTPDPDPAPADRPLVLVGPPTGPQGGGVASDGVAADDSDSAKAGQQGAASDSGGE